ncbi:UNVERIFIED_CONTAM: hypothetical protein FKN15_027651 [Acipenser sinensis]
MGRKQRQKQQQKQQQHRAGRKPNCVSGLMDVCMTCLRGEEWCFEVGEVGHVSPDYYPSPPQEEEGEPEAQPPEEVSWEAQYCCCICGEWGHYPANCPLTEGEEPLPPSPPEGKVPLPPLPPPPPGGEEQELPLPPPSPGGEVVLPLLPSQ